MMLQTLAQKHGKQLSGEVTGHILQTECFNPLYLTLLVQDLLMMDRYEHAVIDRYVSG